MKKGNSRHQITFTKDVDVEAVALAQLGFTGKYIEAHCNLSSGKTQYRISKAQRADGLPKGTGYRTQFRNGQSETSKTVMDIMMPQVKKLIKTSLPPHFTTKPINP